MLHLALTALLVRDYDEAIAFYVGRAGFQLIEDTDQGKGKRWVVVRPAGSQAGLLLAKAVGAQEAFVGSQAGGRVFLFLYRRRRLFRLAHRLGPAVWQPRETPGVPGLCRPFARPSGGHPRV